MNPQDHDLDQDWAALLESLEPDAAQLAAAERELAELDEAAPLPAANIDAMVAAAVAATRAAPVVPLTSARRHVRRMLLVAALAVVALPSVAWFARGLWTERVHSILNMSFGEAVAICVEPENEDHTRLSAMTLLVNECDYAIKALTKLTDDPEAPLRAAANEQLRYAREAVAAPVVARPEQVAGDIRAAAPIAGDDHQSPQRRLAAIEVIGGHLRVGAQAMSYAHLRGEEAEQQRQIFVTFLQQALAR
ncbi:MAG: hypothetical protein H6838_10270 [Planctomycetes bacterium]|nr:hypothetical protein [Planctomycetota bacterium]MCB9885869.1 hypothetical protein [Planctomycetota bacterium]